MAGRFTAMQRYVCSWNTSRHGADIVSVPPQPRQPSHNGGESRSSSGSLAILAAMRWVSSRLLTSMMDGLSLVTIYPMPYSLRWNNPRYWHRRAEEARTVGEGMSNVEARTGMLRLAAD